MQIDDGRILGWLWDGLAALAGLVGILLMLIWRGDRGRLKKVEEGLPQDAKNRLSNLEVKMSQAVSLTQVETIVHRVEDEFKEEHNAILKAIREDHAETREYIRDMFDARDGKWNGRDRRAK